MTYIYKPQLKGPGFKFYRSCGQRGTILPFPYRMSKCRLNDIRTSTPMVPRNRFLVLIFSDSTKIFSDFLFRLSSSSSSFFLSFVLLLIVLLLFFFVLSRRTKQTKKKRKFQRKNKWYLYPAFLFLIVRYLDGYYRELLTLLPEVLPCPRRRSLVESTPMRLSPVAIELLLVEKS